MNKSGLSVLCIALLLPAVTLGLPEDENQDIVIEASRNEIFLNQGIVIYYGEPGLPAEVNQGSLKITGMEIQIERRNGELQKVTAQGNPATFQQQPETDQAIVYANAASVLLDNTVGLLILDDNAELTQDGTMVAGQHIEYDREAERIVSDSRNGEGRIRMVIPPQNNTE